MKIEYRLGVPPITTNGCVGRKILAKVTDVQGLQFDLQPIYVSPEDKTTPPLILESGWTIEAKLYETTRTDTQSYIGELSFVVTDEKSFQPAPVGTFGVVQKKKV